MRFWGYLMLEDYMSESRGNIEIRESDLFRYLGNPTRLRIVKLLIDGEKNVTELQELLGNIKQGNLSDHLA
jgi:DNA-binding transcriptional ArsR family regulator